MILTRTNEIEPFFERSNKVRDIFCAINIKEDPKKRSVNELSKLVEVLKNDDFEKLNSQIAEVRIAIERLQINLGNTKAVDFEVMRKIKQF